MKDKPATTAPGTRQTAAVEPSRDPGVLQLQAEVDALVEELKDEEARSEDYLRRLQYLQADFENYRRRMEREMSDAKRIGNERLLSDLLLVNDELELALQKASEKNENPAIVEGVGMVHKRLQGILAKEGVDRINSLGETFNPDLHDAALRVPSEEPEGTIVEEIRPGYLLKGKVLRPSIVKVAEKGSPVEPGTGKGEES